MTWKGLSLKQTLEAKKIILNLRSKLRDSAEDIFLLKPSHHWTGWLVLLFKFEELAKSIEIFQRKME